MTENAAVKAYQLGKKYEQIYTGCSQCVIAALQDTFNIRNDAIFKAATGLAAGGGASIDGSCGAYSGGIMVLSYLMGREREDFADSGGILLRNFELIRKLRDEFIQEYGSVICCDIQTKIFGRSYYLADMDEFEMFEKAGGHDALHCPEVVGKAARWAATLINEARLA
ncbi:MAG: C_GCAxxG_C_C family protein [Dehalococcoidales bacterium]|nr:C_GCAxxG_C_C family protein [Dehalococcoidales bacterium]